MNVIINEVYPSVMAGMVTIDGEINGREFTADIYPHTRKLESVKIEDTYVYAEELASVSDVKYKAESAEFIFELQQQVKKSVETIDAR